MMILGASQLSGSGLMSSPGPRVIVMRTSMFTGIARSLDRPKRFGVQLLRESAGDPETRRARTFEAAQSDARTGTVSDCTCASFRKCCLRTESHGRARRCGLQHGRDDAVDVDQTGNRASFRHAGLRRRSSSEPRDARARSQNRRCLSALRCVEEVPSAASRPKWMFIGAKSFCGVDTYRQSEPMAVSSGNTTGSSPLTVLHRIDSGHET